VSLVNDSGGGKCKVVKKEGGKEVEGRGGVRPEVQKGRRGSTLGSCGGYENSVGKNRG